MLDPIELPDELRQEAQPSPEEAAAHYTQLQKIGSLVAGKRDDIVKARTESGIEDVWTYCEEAYASIDDLNRGDGDKQQWRKPTSPSGPLTSKTRAPETRSTVFVPLTRRYVDMGAAKIKEKALPIDDKPFSMKPTAKPDMVTPVAQAVQMVAGAAPAAPIPQPAPPGTPPAAPATPSDPDAQIEAKATTAADKASERIYDWLSEAKYTSHIARVIDDGARIGVGILKGPFPDNRTDRAWTVKDGVGALEMVKSTAPGVKSIDPWNFFPARNCGEDIHDGDICAERSFLSEGKLRALSDLEEPGGLPIYLSDQIEKVIAEGPEKVNVDSNGRRENADKKGLYTVWDIFCEMTRADMIALNAVGAEELPEEITRCFAIVTLVNDTVIRAQFNPLSKSGHFPYRVFCWSRRVGMWAGVGVGEQVSVPQRQVNAGTRAWMNNAGVSSGVQIVFDEMRVYPIDGSMTIGGGIKLWGLTEAANGADVRSMFNAVEIPNLGEELKAIVDYAFRMAEEMSNIPLVSQGQTGPQDPQTFGQAELQNSNANTLLRQVSDYLDTCVIEPLVGDLYEWLLLDEDVPDEEKGDFQIVAQGCTAMVEKAIQEQTLVMLGGMTLNPAYGMSPSRWAEEFARSKRLDPERLKYTDQEKQTMAANGPPKSPQEKVAEINVAGKLHAVDMQLQAEQQALQTGGATPHGARAMATIETARIRAASAEGVEASRANAEAARAEKELEVARQSGEYELERMRIQRDLAILQYAHDNNQNLMQVKADLAQTAMNNQTKKELAAAELQLAANEGSADRTVDLHKHHNPSPSLVRDEVSTPTTP
jgi:hypothetical protein